MAAPLLEKLSESLGSPEPAVRLILSILIGYPFALLYRWVLFYQPASVIHLFHTFSGLALAAFNFAGSQLYHSVICVFVQFLMLRLMGRTVTTVLCSFTFQMVYLLLGYYYTATDEYDIKWTMPHCVLTLKLIGLSFDYYDGGKEPSQLSAEQKIGALPSVPSLLEVFGFSYFYGGFLVGPQFTLRSYQRLVGRELTDCPGKPPNSLLPAMKRFSLGFLCLAIYAIFSPSYPDSYYLTDEYEAQPFWYRCVFILLWGKVILYKYVSCWVIAEGVCILTGLGYNGVVDGKHQWDACANMKVWLFETTPLFGGTIASFNINTNAWAARHVFKRLKFLGNKTLSHVATLLFLTIWHGLHSGYILCFSMEFFIITVERQVQALVRDSPLLTKLANSHLYPLIYVVQQFIHWLFMGYPLVPFCLFAYDKWLKVYSSVYFCGHVFFLVAYLIMPFLRKTLVPKKDRSEKKHD
ncbi:lysophospholipid acyltransferase 5 isoform X1 [Austrofundulus limnaeus]|uniref:Lysophospholipid acyltransferase 5 n=1 Tax=Austrofundulus limnaeus TaxID=52670 RepID=A0A2I4BME9_AUSLI|nr:PREDICTED: lysophospholipid acyltransferase 5 isoform X1 [Austrofundulus limnaeus]XP_013868921.1 PREDICTED: lysophospholipid acyltransferase 5 isoform X1 [Austrofundulus limnaeus]